MIEGCITALVTPMTAEGEIDFDSLERLIEWQVENGVSGLVVNGSTGEAATLTYDEKFKLIDFVIKVVAKRAKIVVGIGSACTRDTVDSAKEINAISGVDYLMCLTPYYVKPTQEGLYLHFKAVAEVSRLPILLYNVPGRTSSNLSDKTVLRLAHDFSNIVGIKDASGDIRRCLNLLADKPDNFSLLSGDDHTALAFMLCGGNGVISVVSNIRPGLFVAMCKAALAADKVAAVKVNSQLLPLYDLLFCESNPIPVKWGLYREGRLNSGFLRLPLTELAGNHRLRLEECLAQITG